MMLLTTHSWEHINANKIIDLRGITSFRIHNNGNASFVICGQTILPNETYNFLSDGSVSNFRQQLNFLAGNSKRAVLEQRKIIGYEEKVVQAMSIGGHAEEEDRR